MAVLLGAAMLAVAACGSSSPARTTTSAAAPVHRPELRNPNSVSAVLRFTKRIPCLNGNQRLGGPAAVRQFHAVTAIACTREFRTIPGKGQFVVYVRRVAVGDLDALEDYFEQPTVAKHPKGSDCSDDEEDADDTIRVPVFVDATGRTLIPLIPDVCGASDEDADDATGGQHVRWHVVWMRRLRRVP